MFRWLSSLHFAKLRVLLRSLREDPELDELFERHVNSVDMNTWRSP